MSTLGHDTDLTKVELIDNSEIITIAANFDIAILPQDYPGATTPLLMPDAGDFAKWLRKSHPNINLFYEKPGPRIALRGADFWLPLMIFANDITLPIGLNLISNYVYDKMKGCLKGDSARVHVEAIFSDSNSGVSKRFKYEGDVAGLEKVIQRGIDLKKLME